jgi:hypothetical protein
LRSTTLWQLPSRLRSEDRTEGWGGADALYPAQNPASTSRRRQQETHAPQQLGGRSANETAQVTSTIVAELERGAIPWTKPWRNITPVGSVMPDNAATNRPYSGINIPILWGAALGGGYDRHLWMTSKQALAAAAQVRGGEHGTAVVFTKKLTVGDDEEEEERLVSMLLSDPASSSAICHWRAPHPVHTV